ncbi:chloride channel protein [Methylobacterium haplocladii]|uniref:Chloride channel protein n=1 Tax=Methylobacterium haplocladii TaxID=1176176 RepID=A0A512ITX3_9HYPH|nr:chloride channel protein [Methylobacterium haplocladii]GEP01106.1 chloride channel protein [Methylobacterium haplocladii]GJD82934.1 H(+)/Cl(-) exchange transporter ClcA [Methylobacterium haplocladii]GLS60931.1 chloride channel protein [Methylobacterium haplocladii]
MQLRPRQIRRTLLRLRGASLDSWEVWRRRLLFLVGGLCVGLAAVVMAKLADGAQALFKQGLAFSPWLTLVVTPAAFGIAAFLARTVFPNAQGSGIPQVIAARAIGDAKARHALVSLKVAAGKIVVMTLGLLGGASVGREGPTVQVGAAIMAAFGRFSPARLSGLLLAGGSAGVAAAFNTPLAGIVFGIEELGRAYDSRASGLIVAAVIAAGLTSLAILGDYTYFGTTSATLPFSANWLAVPLLGAAGGLMGGLFSRIVILFGTGLPGRAGAWIAAHPVAFAVACGLGVSVCGLVAGGTVYGTGYEEARAILHGEDAVDRGFAPLKFAATVFSSISAIPGGLFAPSLAVGAGLGAEARTLFAEAPIGALVLIGMVSYLTGVLQAPITSFVIVTEMTQDHAMMIPLMIAAVIADAVSKLVCKEGIYHALAEALVAKAEPACEGFSASAAPNGERGVAKPG